MKALTVYQPWATLIAIRAKTIETRTRSTSYRGPIAIHAAARRPEAWLQVGPWWISDHGTPSYPFWMSRASDGGRDFEEHHLPLGCIVATCVLADVRPIESFPGGSGFRGTVEEVTRLDHERAFGDFTPGCFAWLLDDIVQLDEPIPARGQQGLWNWDAP